MNGKPDALASDAGLPFGHPGQDYAESPEGGVVHYGPGDWPLCGEGGLGAVHTDDPHRVAGCGDCLELVAEDLADDNEYRGRCLHCGEAITAAGGVAWRRAVRRPCPHCGRGGW